jgi:hypothetical protein
MAILQKIRQRIKDRDYFLRDHAEDEMHDDNFERADVENAVLNGKIVQKLTEDMRGTRYVIEGPAEDGKRHMRVVCRYKESCFKESPVFVIITVWEVIL